MLQVVPSKRWGGTIDPIRDYHEDTKEDKYDYPDMSFTEAGSNQEQSIPKDACD